MAKVPVDRCPASPTLDAIVARVRRISEDGWPWYCYVLQHSIDMASSVFDGTNWCYACNSLVELQGRLPRPVSTDIAAAWVLVEVLTQDYEFYITNYRNLGGGWSACYKLKAGEWTSSDADTAPLAIVHAYLKANGVEYVEVHDGS